MAVRTTHLDWTRKQGRILTCGDRAEEYFSAERGFAFDETELPHHHLLQHSNNTRAVFQSWKQEDEKKARTCSIVGAWKRVLFYGGWEHTTDRDEDTFNLQTRTLFIDLRIPCSRRLLFLDTQQNIQSLQDLLPEQLRWYARQHIFSGYTRLSEDDLIGRNNFDACCTRYHCMDWNFVGKGRTRPNKWWVDLMPNPKGPREHLLANSSSNSRTAPDVWKEWAYATDEHGHHYYCEQWQRWEEDAVASESTVVVALRKRDDAGDGVFIVVGDHFNFCLDQRCVVQPLGAPYDNCASLVDLVDAAVERDDLMTARAWLGMQGGHGIVSRGWKLDHCIEFWREGHSLWKRDDVHVQGDSIANATVVWNGEEWDVFECSLASIVQLRELLQHGVA